MNSALVRPTHRWTLVLPVQQGDRAKSRLGPAVRTARSDLARAIALDSLEAARSCVRVARCVVVTSDAQVAEVAARAGDTVVPDPGTGLDDAVELGIAVAGRAGRSAALGTAVLLADVPALRPAELVLALDSCGDAGYAFVPDQEGTGTVLLAAVADHRLHPRFGVGSAAHHESGGARRIDSDLRSLRRDVDTWDGLLQAAELGLGPRTAALLDGLLSTHRD